MATPARTTPTETSLTTLHTRDTLEAYQHDGQLSYHGEGDTVDPSHGVLWILHGALRERKLIDATEHQIHRRSPAAPAVSPAMGSTVGQHPRGLS